jgi:plasmid stabilization system protein ParE
MAAARRELRRAVSRYDAVLSGLGDEFLIEVHRCIADNITCFPHAGSPHLAGTRRILTRRFPYSIIYKVHGEEIVVMAVSHQRRRPDYWLRRV